MLRIRIWIRIRRILMFSGLPDPDPLVRETGPDPDPSIMKWSTNSKKTIGSYCFVTFVTWFLWLFCWRLEGQWRNSRIRILIRIRIYWSEVWIRGSVLKFHGAPTLLFSLPLLCAEARKSMQRAKQEAARDNSAKSLFDFINVRLGGAKKGSWRDAASSAPPPPGGPSRQRCGSESGSTGSTCFWGLLDPDPDPLVRGMDPDPDPSIIKHKW